MTEDEFVGYIAERIVARSAYIPPGKTASWLADCYFDVLVCDGQGGGNQTFSPHWTKDYGYEVADRYVEYDRWEREEYC